MQYVIGIDAGSAKCSLKAKDLQGRLLAEKTGPGASHRIMNVRQVGRRVAELTDALLAGFGGRKEDCRCLLVGAWGIDSPNDKMIVEDIYSALGFFCPVFCMNDGSVALYAATGGTGVLAISGTGSIAIGRNAEGRITRSGGYSTAIFGDEGSSRWIALTALRHMSQWVDGSVPDSPLVSTICAHFNGFDANKLIQCSNSLRRRPVDSVLADLVIQAAGEGDPAAIGILKKGAGELFHVAETIVKKLGFNEQPQFLSGVWGSVFVNSDIFYNEYKRLFEENYPRCRMIFPCGDAADGAAALALDYLSGRVPFLSEL